MTILARLFLILGVAFISYGSARWYIVPEILSKQEAAFQQFVTAHKAEIDANFSQPTNSPIKQDFYQLKMHVMLSGDLHPGWSQAVIPCAFGFMSLAVSCFFSRKAKHARHEPSTSSYDGSSVKR
jgi:hypothetical protein